MNSGISYEVFSKLTVDENLSNWGKVTSMKRVEPKLSEETERTKNDTFHSSGIIAAQEEENFGQKENICSENMEELSEKFNTLMDRCSK